MVQKARGRSIPHKVRWISQRVRSRNLSFLFSHTLLDFTIVPRFPGGESYKDLMSRLISVVIDIEQQVIPTLVVSHVSILQCLMAYFRNTRVEQCTSIEVPLHTVIKFTPVRGGGWVESHHPMYDEPELASLLRNDSAPSSLPPMKCVESLSEISNGDHSSGSIQHPDSPVITSPIWGDGLIVPNSPQLLKQLSIPSGAWK